MIKRPTVSIKSSFTVLFITVAYLITVATLIGLKADHWIIAFFFNIMYFVHSGTRKFILAFSIFIVFAIIYDLMRAHPNYLVNPVDISTLYHFEKSWFGVYLDHKLLTLNEFFARCNGTFPDVLCGLFYLNWISVPLGFAFFLYIKNKEQFIHFSLTFLLVNIIGFCIYYIHPAAPP